MGLWLTCILQIAIWWEFIEITWMACNLQASSSRMKKRRVAKLLSQQSQVPASITGFERLNHLLLPEIMIPETGATMCKVDI